MSTPQQFAEAFRRGYLGDVTTDGLVGRIIRGQKPEDFVSLSEDPTRLLILLTDPMGLASMVGRSAFDLLLAVGWDYPYAVDKINNGYAMKLVVCKEGGKARLATWESMLDLTGMVYPDVDQKLRRWLPQLKRSKFDDLEKAYGCDMSEVDGLGHGDPRYMTHDRYKIAPDTLENARAFLYFTIHLRELYSGDGWTYDSLGNRGVMEYMALNCPISELDDAVVIDLKAELPAAAKPRVKRTVGARIGFPSYYKPEDVGKRYVPRLDWVHEEAKAANLSPASKDKKKRTLVGIDYQNDFVMPEIKDVDGTVLQKPGSLLVGGAIDDLRRLIEMIYQAPEYFNGLLFSKDKHIPFQIFSPTWWVDRNGKPIAPFTWLTEEAVAAGDYRPVTEKAWSLDYIKKVKGMMIWPFHCLTGTEGSSLAPALVEAIHWLSVGRGIQPQYLFKGTVPQTEHYGPFCPVVEYPGHAQGTLNTTLLDMVVLNDEMIFAGEAEDYCVKQGMIQVLEYFGKKHQQALQKVTFLRDATSMVFPQNRAEADNFLDSMTRQKVRVTTTKELVAA